MKARLFALVLAGCMCFGVAAQSWQAVTDTARLTVILSDVELIGKLTDKTEARAV
jgi:hypothetical protein